MSPLGAFAQHPELQRKPDTVIPSPVRGTTELHEVTIETEGRIHTTAIDYGKVRIEQGQHCAGWSSDQSCQLWTADCTRLRLHP
jgi:hypothetical protein